MLIALQWTSAGVVATELTDDGEAASTEAVASRDLPAWVAAREPERPRWVWSDSSRWYPELLAAGVTVCLGQDDISDAYYPFGRNNMLEVAFLASHLLWMTGRADIERLYDMVTTDAAAAMNVGEFGLVVGKPAHLVVLDAPDVIEALRWHAPPAQVISHGRRLDAAVLRRQAGLAA